MTSAWASTAPSARRRPAWLRRIMRSVRTAPSCNSRGRRKASCDSIGLTLSGKDMQSEFTPPRRFAGVGKKVSVFFAAAVFGMIGIVLLVSYKQGVFVRHTSIYFYVADAFGINKGMAVKLFGLPVGNVKNMQITDQGVKVELGIITEYIPRVPKGSRARMLREGYIGAATIQIVPGVEIGAAMEPVSAGDVIDFIPPSRGVAELIDDFKTQAMPVLTNLSQALAEINDPEGDFRKSAAAARTILEQLPVT